MTNVEAIRTNAENVKKVFAEQALDYDEPSIEWLGGYIDRNREKWDDGMRASLSSTLGSFLGECIIANFGGRWEMTEYGMGVMFDDGNGAFPFNKINKHIENGEEDSIASFYSSLEAMRSANLC